MLYFCFNIFFSRKERSFVPSPRLSLEPSLVERSSLIPYSNSPFPDSEEENRLIVKSQSQINLDELKFDFETTTAASAPTRTTKTPTTSFPTTTTETTKTTVTSFPNDATAINLDEIESDFEVNPAATTNNSIQLGEFKFDFEAKRTATSSTPLFTTPFPTTTAIASTTITTTTAIASTEAPTPTRLPETKPEPEIEIEEEISFDRHPQSFKLISSASQDETFLTSFGRIPNSNQENILSEVVEQQLFHQDFDLRLPRSFTTTASTTTTTTTTVSTTKKTTKPFQKHKKLQNKDSTFFGSFFDILSPSPTRELVSTRRSIPAKPPRPKALQLPGVFVETKKTKEGQRRMDDIKEKEKKKKKKKWSIWKKMGMSGDDKTTSKNQTKMTTVKELSDRVSKMLFSSVFPFTMFNS